MGENDFSSVFISIILKLTLMKREPMIHRCSIHLRYDNKQTTETRAIARTVTTHTQNNNTPHYKG